MSQTFANSINNNPIYAARAEADAAGNTLSTTYATTADLSNYQPTSSMSGYATTGDLSAYLPTSSIGVDSASAITSIAGSSIAGGGGIVTSLHTAYGTASMGPYVDRINALRLIARYAEEDISGRDLTSLASTADLSAYQPTSSMGAYQTTAGMSAYATTGDLSSKLDSSAIQYVSASGDATAIGVVYIVTGTGA